MKNCLTFRSDCPLLTICNFFCAQRTFWYVLHCNSQEEPHLLTLVPPHHRFTILLAFVCYQIPSWNRLRCYELQRPRNDVWLLLLDGNEAPPQVVQSYDHYVLPDFSDGCWRHLHRSGILLLLHRQGMPHRKGKQHSGICHVRELPVFVLAVLYRALLQTQSHAFQKAEIFVSILIVL